MTKIQMTKVQETQVQTLVAVLLLEIHFEEKCGETQTHCNGVIGCTVTGPEDVETHTPRVPINVG